MFKLLKKAVLSIIHRPLGEVLPLVVVLTNVSNLYLYALIYAIMQCPIITNLIVCNF
jgi:hypothetical protein